MSPQPEALQLADWLDDLFDSDGQPKQAAAEMRRLYQVELAYLDWQEKTMWVQDAAKASELGMHRADVLRTRIEQQNAEIKQLRKSLARCLNEAEGWLNEALGCSPDDIRGYDGLDDEARRLLANGLAIDAEDVPQVKERK